MKLTVCQYFTYLDNISVLLKLFNGEDARPEQEINKDAKTKFRKMGLI